MSAKWKERRGFLLSTKYLLTQAPVGHKRRSSARFFLVDPSSVFPLVVRNGACRCSGRATACEVRCRCYERVNPSIAGPKTILPKLDYERSGAVWRDHYVWIARVRWFVTAAGDVECTWRKAGQSIGSSDGSNLNQLSIRGPEHTASSGHSRDDGRRFVDFDCDRSLRRALYSAGGHSRTAGVRSREENPPGVFSGR
jgi:hypothetical protein